MEILRMVDFLNMQHLLDLSKNMLFFQLMDERV